MAETQHTILVVDDDRLILATLANGLEEAGYKVITASSGDEALQLCSAHNPDIALLDIRMPGMSGIELSRKLHEHCPIPYLFLTAYDDQELVDNAIESGALGYLVKPLDVARILPSIETALKRGADIHKLQESESHLTRALSGDRAISTAVGIIMERYRLTEQEAFERLRHNARSARVKLQVTAKELCEASNKLNSL